PRLAAARDARRVGARGGVSVGFSCPRGCSPGRGCLECTPTPGRRDARTRPRDKVLTDGCMSMGLSGSRSPRLGVEPLAHRLLPSAAGPPPHAFPAPLAEAHPGREHAWALWRVDAWPTGSAPPSGRWWLAGEPPFAAAAGTPSREPNEDGPSSEDHARHLHSERTALAEDLIAARHDVAG